MKRTLDFNGFLKSYKAHIERIMERHGVKNPQAVLAFDELLEYIEKRNSEYMSLCHCIRMVELRVALGNSC